MPMDMLGLMMRRSMAMMIMMTVIAAMITVASRSLRREVWPLQQLHFSGKIITSAFVILLEVWGPDF